MNFNTWTNDDLLFCCLTDNSSARRKFRAKVAFSYHPENEDELNLEVDDIIDVVGEPEDGWWEGVVKGHKGVFPSNFVTVLEEDENNMDVANGKADKTDGGSPSVETETKGVYFVLMRVGGRGKFLYGNRKEVLRIFFF